MNVPHARRFPMRPIVKRTPRWITVPARSWTANPIKVIYVGQGPPPNVTLSGASNVTAAG